MQVLDVQLYGQTTSNIRSVAFLDFFVHELRLLFPADDVVAEWAKAGSHRITRASYHSLGEQEKEQMVAEGVLGFSDFSGEQFLAGYCTRRVSARDWARFVEVHGYAQNEITVSVASNAFNEQPFRERVTRFAKRLAVSSHTTFLRVGGGKGYPRVPSNRLGLGAGLPGLYWVNVFGPPFVRIVGKEKLLASPAFEVEELGRDIVYLRVSDEFSAPLEERWASTFRTLRTHIGQEFFVNAEPEVSKPGVLGVSGLVRFLIGARKEFRNEATNALVQPKFDWSEIVIGDE